MRGLRSLLAILLALLAPALAWAEQPVEQTAEQLRFFETKVRPVLAEHCLACHGPKKQWSNFRVDSRASLLAGGDFGEAVVPGNPAESRLIEAVRQSGDELSMPPEGKLTDRQIADLETWIRQGAHFPAEATAKSPFRDPGHWAFQPAGDPPLPEVNNGAWVVSPLDRFLLARLEAEGLAPAPPADKRTLLRRATFDLTGLPPTPAEVADFLSDERPNAFALVVDRLLESPAYGERWGRHWLDVARYADSNGLDENIAHGNAWRYRDYVVAAFNRDKPFRQFVQEQLAGDLLPYDGDAQRGEQLIATGFLSIGPKVLAEVDETKMEMDIIDEQLDTVGRAFLGLTLGCARCHDHKFDPIDAADYYALAGVFKSTQTMDSFTKIAKWHENPLPDAAATARLETHQKLVAVKKEQIQKLVEQASAAVKEKAKEGEKSPEKLEPLYPPETTAQLKTAREELVALEKAAPEIPSAMGVTERAIVDLPIHVRGSHLKLGDVATRRVPVVFTSLEAPQFSTSHSGRLELARWITDEKHPLTYRVFVNRVWRWHFGKGLVRTTDNFGMLGEAPTHPELLDWLAARFVESGASLKSLHRLIMLSSTYRQSSLPAGEAAQHDPENRLWGRFEVRRLEAEAVRDALLAVGGTLDREQGGSLLQVKNREFFFDHTSKDKTEYTSNRRSIYLPIVRNNVYDVFGLLDYPDAAVSTSDRPTTTIAPQALLMLNSELVARASGSLAERVLAAAADDAERIGQLYALAYSREPTADELGAGQRFLRQAEQLLTTTEPDMAERSGLAWQAYCQSILAANEFIYVR
ncbi:MAG: PSD1 and planctomycete cytochrome C domain-containing protein [Pirellulaceae bacterium]